MISSCPIEKETKIKRKFPREIRRFESFHTYGSTKKEREMRVPASGLKSEARPRERGAMQVKEKLQLQLCMKVKVKEKEKL
jgi:hypothetical protein